MNVQEGCATDDQYAVVVGDDDQKEKVCGVDPQALDGDDDQHAVVDNDDQKTVVDGSINMQ